MVPNTEVVDTELEPLQETFGIRKKGLTASHDGRPSLQTDSNRRDGPTAMAVR